MAANIFPIFSRTPKTGVAGSVIGPTANTATDGTGSAMTQIFVADATEGSFIHKVILRPVASPAATVARLWLLRATGAFTAGTTNTAANTGLIGEIGLPAVTVSQVNASFPFEIPVGFAIEAGYSLLMSFGTSTGAAGNGYNPVTIAGAY